jgi:ankyrin repeat protein
MDQLNTAVLAHDLSGIDSLLKRNENIEIKDQAGRTPLLNAVIEDSIPMVKILLEHGANIHVQDKLGYSALHYASQNQSIEMVNLLIERGSIIDAIDANGNTPLWRAVFNSRGRGEIIQMLISAGADKKRKNNHGVSPLDLANSIGNYAVKKYLD